jgi:hypothetical protein
MSWTGRGNWARAAFISSTMAIASGSYRRLLEKVG